MTAEMTTVSEGENSAAPADGVGVGATWLLCRTGTMLCALPIGQVREIMRMLPIKPLAAAPRYVVGLSIVRGAPVPVVDIGLLVSDAATQASRLVLVEAGGRPIALAVQSVAGIADIGEAALGQLPPLLQDSAADTITAVGARDSELLLCLRAGRMVPDQVFDRLAETLS